MPGVVGSGDDPLVLKFGMTLPFRRKVYRTRAAAHAHTVTGLEAQRRTRARNLEAAVAEARFRFDDATRELSLYRDRLIPKAREALEVYLTSFQAGKTGYLDLIEAERDVLDFQLALDQAIAQRFAASAELEALLGHGEK